MKHFTFLFIMCVIMFGACSNSDTEDNSTTTVITNGTEDDGTNGNDENSTSTDTTTLKILALGDSYTIGESVCETCRFPSQLKDSLINRLNRTDISAQIIARTGWTTTNLIDAITTENPSSDYNLVTLLIGVNNQYQHKPFDVFTNDFPVLMQKALAAVNGDRNKVIVISIPDYAFTPFGQNSSSPETISLELDQYNAFAQNYCAEREIPYVNITDITRLGLEQTALVASDGLHPSELAYSKFVERLLPIAIEKLQ